MLSLDAAWTDVPGGQEPSTHYLVLGISRDEYDPGVIEEAALVRAAFVRAYQLTHASECTRLLDQIARALITLLDPDKRREYDLGLDLCARHAESDQPAATADRALADPSCDVELVCRTWS
jgi:hypothetical protein